VQVAGLPLSKLGNEMGRVRKKGAITIIRKLTAAQSHFGEPKEWQVLVRGGERHGDI
jgi:hypothetical protein